MLLAQEPVESLVEAAVAGNETAWRAIVDRYAALVWSVCRGFRLSQSDAADVSQTVWLRTVERLQDLREPAALPGWLVTTTRRECLRTSTSRERKNSSLDAWLTEPAADEETTAPETELLAAERRAMVREAFSHLPEHCQQLLALLIDAQERSYVEISARLSMPVGSIGPTRSRCIAKLRHSPAFERWMAAAPSEQRAGDHYV
jgi:RNA polymerase sigma factor (sigma-70 family)